MSKVQSKKKQITKTLKALNCAVKEINKVGLSKPRKLYFANKVRTINPRLINKHTDRDSAAFVSDITKHIKVSCVVCGREMDIDVVGKAYDEEYVFTCSNGHEFKLRGGTG